MKKQLNYIAYLIILGGALAASCQNNKYKILETIVEETNKTCPQMMDEYTVLDSLATKTDSLMFYYTLLAELEEMEVTDEAKEIMKAGLVQNLKLTPPFNAIKNLDVKVIHTYRYNDGRLFLQIAINPEDYK